MNSHLCSVLLSVITLVAFAGCGTDTESRVPSATDRQPPPLKVVDSPVIPGVNFRFQEHPEAFSSFVYHNGEDNSYFAILEALGGGAAVLDYDRDGMWDACFPGGGDLLPGDQMRSMPTSLWRNLGRLRFTDISQILPPMPHFSHGAASADSDGDGFADLLLTGYGGVQLLRNQGDGTFAESTFESRIENQSWGTTAAWGDLNGDGFLDLYIGNYVDWSFSNNPTCLSRPELERDTCPPRGFEGLLPAVFASNGDGTYRRVEQDWGLNTEGKTLGVLIVDLDNDRDLDIYVANDSLPNFVYRNDGDGFSDVSVISGADRNDRGLPDGSMGLEAFDFNGDFLPDIWVSNYEQESMALYRSHPDGFYRHVSQSMGVAGIGPTFVGWGIHISDFDADGDEDLVIATGHAIRNSKTAPRFQQPIFLVNEANRRFSNVGAHLGGYFSKGHLGRGVSGCDFDNDGRCDLLITHLRESPMLLRNTSTTTSNWIGAHLIGGKSSRDPIGARILLKTATDTQVRFVKGGSSYLSTSDPRLLFAIPTAADSVNLQITWPSGAVQDLVRMETNRYHTIIEPVSRQP